MAVKSRNPNRDLQTEPRAQRASKSNNPDASKPIFTAKSQPFPQISDLKQSENPVCNSQGLVTAIDWRPSNLGSGPHCGQKMLPGNTELGRLLSVQSEARNRGRASEVIENMERSRIPTRYPCLKKK
jgi:hypothetical protein